MVDGLLAVGLPALLSSAAPCCCMPTNCACACLILPFICR